MNVKSLVVSVSIVMAVAPIILRPSAASGQSLHLAELFAEQGRIDDARAEVLAWFEIRGDEATPNEVQHGLWLRGRFAQETAAGLADLERLIEDFPDGPYTGHALAWLASAASEAGDDVRAAALYSRVAESHPDSEAAGPARDWLHQRGITIEPRVMAPPPRDVSAPGRPLAQTTDTASPPASRAPARADSAAPKPPRMAPDSSGIAVATVDSAMAMAGEPPEAAVPPVSEVVDSVPVPQTPAVDTTRSVTIVPTDTVSPPAADSTPPQDAAPAEAAAPPPAAEPEPARIPPGPPVPGAATAGAFAVQIGAFRNPIGAGGLVDELIAAGFDARLVQVPVNDLLRVRIGRFATLEQAQAELERVRAAGRDGAVVNDARRETQVR